MKCKKCKKETTEATSHKCQRCENRLCIPCDNSSSYMNWIEVSSDIEVPEEYLCQKCEKRISQQSATLPCEKKLKEKTLPSMLEG